MSIDFDSFYDVFVPRHRSAPILPWYIILLLQRNDDKKIFFFCYNLTAYYISPYQIKYGFSGFIIPGLLLRNRCNNENSAAKIELNEFR